VDDTELLRSLVDQLGCSGVQVAAVFGRPALKDRHGKAFACLHGGALACRLGQGTQAHTDALALADAHLFDPSERDRPMPDWVSIPRRHLHRWPEFAAAALSVPH
jgi:hypothetical protein